MIFIMILKDILSRYDVFVFIIFTITIIIYKFIPYQSYLLCCRIVFISKLMKLFFKDIIGIE